MYPRRSQEARIQSRRPQEARFQPWRPQEATIQFRRPQEVRIQPRDQKARIQPWRPQEARIQPWRPQEARIQLRRLQDATIQPRRDQEARIQPWGPQKGRIQTLEALGGHNSTQVEAWRPNGEHILPKKAAPVREVLQAQIFVDTSRVGAPFFLKCAPFPNERSKTNNKISQKNTKFKSVT